MLHEELTHEGFGAQVIWTAVVGEKVVAADADVAGVGEHRPNALDCLPFRSFDVHLQQVNLLDPKLSRKSVDSTGRYVDAATAGLEHGVAQVVLGIGYHDRAVGV